MFDYDFKSEANLLSTYRNPTFSIFMFGATIIIGIILKPSINKGKTIN